MTAKKQDLDVGLIRTDAPEGTRFLVLRIRPLCHNAFEILIGVAYGVRKVPHQVEYLKKKIRG